MLPFVPSATRLYFNFGEPIRTDHYTKEARPVQLRTHRDRLVHSH